MPFSRMATLKISIFGEAHGRFSQEPIESATAPAP